MGRQNGSKEKLNNQFTAVFAPISFSMAKTTHFGGLFLLCRAEPPCTPLGGDEWYDRVIFRAEYHYHAVSPFGQRSERKREGRETAKSL